MGATLRNVLLNSVIIGNYNGPTANFTGTPTSGASPLTVNFTDTSTGSPTSWLWDFKNDGSATSTQQNPSYTYTAAGTYAVKLTATNPSGSDTVIKSSYITATNPAPDPNYLWDSSVTTGNPSGSVRTFTEDNALFTITGIVGTTNAGMRTVTPITGKVYVELELTAKSSILPFIGFGLIRSTQVSFSPYGLGTYNIVSRRPTTTGGCGFTQADSVNNANVAVYATRYAFEPGDRIGIAVDMSAGKAWYSKNGAWIDGDPVAGTGASSTIPAGTYYFAVQGYTCGVTGTSSFSSRIYPKASNQNYAAPSGFTPYDPV